MLHFSKIYIFIIWLSLKLHYHFSETSNEGFVVQSCRKESCTKGKLFGLHSDELYWSCKSHKRCYIFLSAIYGHICHQLIMGEYVNLCIVVKDNTTEHQRIHPAHAPKFPVLECDLCNLKVLLLQLYKFNWHQPQTHTENETLSKTAKIFYHLIYSRLNCSSCGLDNYTCVCPFTPIKKKKKACACK